jgi:hypothetical protein
VLPMIAALLAACGHPSTCEPSTAPIADDAVAETVGMSPDDVLDAIGGVSLGRAHRDDGTEVAVLVSVDRAPGGATLTTTERTQDTRWWPHLETSELSICLDTVAVPVRLRLGSSDGEVMLDTPALAGAQSGDFDDWFRMAVAADAGADAWDGVPVPDDIGGVPESAFARIEFGDGDVTSVIVGYQGSDESSSFAGYALTY